MGTKKLHVIVFVLLIVLTTFFSYKLVYAIGERYFYDKLFYRKSITYGYTEQNKDLTVFGKRAKDIILLRNIADKGAHVLGIQDDPQLHNMYLSFHGLQNFRWVSSRDYLLLFPGPVTNSEKFWNVWRVSNKEGHFSAVANIFFADALFKEITSSSDWKFVNR